MTCLFALFWQAADGNNEDVGNSGQGGSFSAGDHLAHASQQSNSSRSETQTSEEKEFQKEKEKQKQREKGAKENQRKAAASGGWLPSMITGMFKKSKTEMKLPDDKNPTVNPLLITQLTGWSEHNS